MSLILIVFCLAAVALLLAAEYAGNRTLKWIAKPAASAAFIALAINEGALQGGPFGVLMLVGLVLCAAGDVFLIPRASRWFLAGMGAFALGHGAYVGAFLTRSPDAKPLVYFAAIAMIAVGGGVLRMLWGKLGEMRGPVTAYVVIISVMVVTSFAAAPAASSTTGSAYDWRLIAGAVGFAASDIAVARDQFAKPDFINRLWGLPLYYAAQLTLASSV